MHNKYQLLLDTFSLLKQNGLRHHFLSRVYLYTTALFYATQYNGLIMSGMGTVAVRIDR